MTTTLTRAAFVAGYAPAGLDWTGDALRRLYAVEAAGDDPQTARKAGAVAALLAAIHRRRIQTHTDAAAALAAILAALAAGLSADSLRDAVDVDVDGTRDERRAQAAAELRRQATVVNVMPLWRQHVRDAHTDAVLAGTAAAAHYASAGQIPAEPEPAALPDLFDPDPWIAVQLAGLGGDIARRLVAGNADDVSDAELAQLVDDGAGADYYLDQQLGDEFLKATLGVYRDIGVNYVDWQTMSDERVCERCIGYTTGNPYRLDQVPESHGRCRCWITPTD